MSRTLNSTMGVFIRRGEQTYREKQHVKVEVEIGVMHLQAKEPQELLATKEPEFGCLASRLWKNKYLLF